MGGNWAHDLSFGNRIPLVPNWIIILAKHFIDEFSKHNNITVKRLSKQAIEKLLAYNYPGNIRELKAVIDLSIVLCDGNEILTENLNFPTTDSLNEMLMEEKSLKEYTRNIIDHLIICSPPVTALGDPQNYQNIKL